MALAIGGRTMSLPAEGSLATTGQYRFATIDANDRGALAAADSEVLVGIGQDKPAAIDRPWAVQIDGVSKLKLGGTVTDGQRIKSDATGQGVATTTATDNVGALALADGVSGDIIPVLVIPGSFGA